MINREIYQLPVGKNVLWCDDVAVYIYIFYRVLARAEDLCCSIFDQKIPPKCNIRKEIKNSKSNVKKEDKKKVKLIRQQ